MRFIFILFFILHTTIYLSAQSISSAAVDSLVAQTQKAFDVPGIVVAIIKDGKIIHSKGYGVQSLATNKKVDEHTLFGIASNTKAFTSTALGILIDEGKLTWDTKVTDIIPEFKLYNPYVTEEFTIRDLLTHRSGLGLGAGDLMIWPDSTHFSKQDIIRNLRYLKPVSGFRTKYDYDNLLYIVAGEVIARVSGISWERFIETRIMKPLQMTGSAASISHIKDKSAMISPHAPLNGKIQPIQNHISEQANAAGGIWSNLTDMSRWVLMQLNEGKYGDSLSRKLISAEVHSEMWTPQTIIPVRTVYIPYKTRFASYGLGWNISDVAGYKQVMHTGGLAGIVTQVLLLPELKLGIIVLTNQQASGAFTAISNTIKDSYLNIKTEWVEFSRKKQLRAEAYEKQVNENAWKQIREQQQIKGNIDLHSFTGTYRDEWFGDVTVSLKNDKLWFRAAKSGKLNGELLPYKGNTLVATWNDRSMNADAYVVFSLDKDGRASGFSMEAISPLTDFSFDFQDLEFKKVTQRQ